MRPITLFLVFFFVGVLFTVSGCSDSERDEDLETLTAREVALGYHIFDDAIREVHRFAMRDSLLNDTGIRQWFNSCIEKAFVDDTVAVFPLVLTINYGGEDNLCDDGFERFGIIRATFTGKYLNKGTEIVFEFDEYYKDWFKVEGTMTLENLGLNNNGFLVYKWTVEDGHITGTNTDFTWSGEHTRYWVAGRSVDSEGIIDDDVFNIDGICEGRSSRGNLYTNEITANYVADYGCQWFTTGRSDLTVPNIELRKINFGDGQCDSWIVVRRNNTFFDVGIPY